MTIMRMYNSPDARFPWNALMNTQDDEERRCDFVPSTNILENENGYRLEIAVPGFSKKDFRIDLEKDLLTISSDRQNGKEEDVRFTRREFNQGNFCRSFHLPETVNTDDIRAEYRNGILMVSLPKKEEVKVKKEIQVS